MEKIPFFAFVCLYATTYHPQKITTYPSSEYLGYVHGDAAPIFPGLYQLLCINLSWNVEIGYYERAVQCHRSTLRTERGCVPFAESSPSLVLRFHLLKKANGSLSLHVLLVLQISTIKSSRQIFKLAVHPWSYAKRSVNNTASLNRFITSPNLQLWYR